MKMHLVLAAAFAGLCSHAAFADPAASVGQQPEPISPTRSIVSLTGAMAAPISSLRRDNPTEFGSPAKPDAAARIVRLKSGSHWVNVAYDESVTFVVKSETGLERSFAWRFNVAPNTSHVDLSDVAPADLPVRGVRVFVTPDPRYSGE